MRNVSPELQADIWNRRRFPPAALYLIRRLNKLAEDAEIPGLADLPHAMSGRLLLPILECEASALLSLTYEFAPQALHEVAPRLLGSLNGCRRDEVIAQIPNLRPRGLDSLQLRRRRWVQVAVYCGVGPREACDRAAAEISNFSDWPAHPAPVRPSAIASERRTA